MTGRWAAMLRDPLTHFLVAGAAVFLLLPGESDLSSRRIDVSKSDLVGFLQTKARLFDGRSFEEIYEGMAPAQRRRLLDDYVRQEALYRRARSEGLDEADPVIRSRLVQQMELLLRDDALADVDLTRGEAEAYYRQHRGDYASPGTATFTHIFFDRRDPAASAKAASVLAGVRAREVAAEDALELGDRFIYQRNYADATLPALLPEVGQAVARAVFEAPIGHWTGPFQSPFGTHLVLVTRRSGAATPALDAIYPAVTRDALEAKRTELGNRAVAKLLDDYTVVRAADLDPVDK